MTRAVVRLGTLKGVLLTIAGFVVVLGAGVYAAFQLSPWPSVWLIRSSFDQGAAEAAASVAPHIPEGISAQRGISYAPGDKDALLDVFAPLGANEPLPAVIWVHGGGFISGSRSDLALAGYMQVLASRGFVTVAVDYTPAPEAQFPTPVRQTNAALDYVIANAKRYNIDPSAHLPRRRLRGRSDCGAGRSCYFGPGLCPARRDRPWHAARVTSRADPLLRPI